MAEALDAYHDRDEVFPGGADEARQVEREVMLQIIDQRWREHLSEMDYLREGINLRAMGQQDPLVAWQREGFEMFGQMMDAIDDDYLRYVMHVQVVAELRMPQPDLTQAQLRGGRRPRRRARACSTPSGPPPPEVEAVAAGAGVPVGRRCGRSVRQRCARPRRNRWTRGAGGRW